MRFIIGFIVNGLVGYLLMLFVEWLIAKEAAKIAVDQKTDDEYEAYADDMNYTYEMYFGSKAKAMLLLSTILTALFWEILLPGIYWFMRKEILVKPQEEKDS